MGDLEIVQAFQRTEEKFCQVYGPESGSGKSRSRDTIPRLFARRWQLSLTITIACD